MYPIALSSGEINNCVHVCLLWNIRVARGATSANHNTSQNYERFRFSRREYLFSMSQVQVSSIIHSCKFFCVMRGSLVSSFLLVYSINMFFCRY
jgi:hypothetical protein